MFKYKNILVVTDNNWIYAKFLELIEDSKIKGVISFTFNYSAFSKVPIAGLEPIDIKNSVGEIISKYDLVFSLHCKQLFPKELVEKVKCINVHPGFNPYNRGWYPQVFSIINKLPFGATIHEIDEELDHGFIIDQEVVEINAWDTSYTSYIKVLDLEIKLLWKNIYSILENNYQRILPVNEGNLNLKKDFQRLCELNLKEIGSFEYFIDKLRALNHGNFKNAFFVDIKTNKKIFVTLNLDLDE